MIVYEVNVEVDDAVREAYRAWLGPHVAEILALPGFIGASVFAVREPAPPAGRHAWCMQFRLHDVAALDAYLREHAPRLRADGVARFGGKFTAARRVMQTADDLPS